MLHLLNGHHRYDVAEMEQVTDHRFDTHDTINSYHLGHTPNQRIDETFVVELLNPMHIPESQWI